VDQDRPLRRADSSPTIGIPHPASRIPHPASRIPHPESRIPSRMHPNWFIAIPVAEAAIVEALPPPPRGLRVFAADDLHLTVAFLGPVGEGRARAAFEAMAWPLGSRAIGFGEVVPMGSPRSYSALSALLTEGRDEVEAAMESARDQAFAAAGIEGERRPPLAHLTLARPARSANAEQREAALAWARAVDLSRLQARIDSIALYTWSQDRSQRLFAIVARR
jgi:2'-5' RNA ligase